MAKKLKIQNINISVSVSYVEDDGNSEAPVRHFSDSANFNVQNESELNKAVTEKAYLADLVGPIVKKVSETHDSENKAAKNFLSKL